VNIIINVALAAVDDVFTVEYSVVLYRAVAP
jgi:hypothetical protein